jgi:hypothetical protein
MDLGGLLTRWTVRLALVLYVVALGLRIRAAGSETKNPSEKGSDPLPRCLRFRILADAVLPRGGGLTPFRTDSKLRRARLAWTVGFLVFLLHVACAFQFFYGWSNTMAYAETARRTAELVGLAWGGGLYANYAFTLLWAADVCWWWIAPSTYRARPCGVEWAVQGFLGFIAFNGAVVFGAGAVRWLGLAACLLLAGLGGLRGLAFRD